MGKRKKIFGVCRICGNKGQLSYEHVPPEAAFNDGKYYYTSQMDKIFKLGDSDFDILSLKNKNHLTKKQGGIGFYTLCNKCNNDTGTWYGNNFLDWIYQSMAIILKAKKNPTLYYPTFFYPLRVIKQVITMFFSINHDDFRLTHPEIVRFILNKELKGLQKNIKIYCYYNIEGNNRYIGNNVVGDFSEGSAIHLSELTFPPIGFVMTFDSTKSPDKRLTEITHFSNYGYNEWIDHFQKFDTLPTHLPFFASDYRSKKEIIQGIAENLKKKNNS